MKGIILAGGSGTRLYPITATLNKHLLPVYDKPMIYYPLSTIMLAGIREMLFISTPKDLPLFQQLLGNGNQWGIQIIYEQQETPAGIAQAFIIGKEFIQNDACCLILGDNIFYGEGMANILQKASRRKKGATIFSYWVNEPQRYGVVEFDQEGTPQKISEKPEKAISNYAVTGIYFYDNQVVNVAQTLKPSKRNELEITDVNNFYLAQGTMDVKRLGRGTAWLDTGTPSSLAEATHFIETVENRQGLKIGCPEEVAWRMGWITKHDLECLTQTLPKNAYSEYLLRLTRNGPNLI